MYRRLFYFFLMFVLMVVCQANSCSEHDEMAANGLDLKLEGKWCVTTKIDQQTTDMTQHVTAYWDIQRHYTYALHEVVNGKEATYTDGVLSNNGAEWSTKADELDVTMTQIELMPYKGGYSFSSPDKLVMVLKDGTKLVIERIKEIK